VRNPGLCAQWCRPEGDGSRGRSDGGIRFLCREGGKAGDQEEEAADNPPIIAETRVDIPESNVADAVMLLDLRNTNALMFRNSGTGSFNMVYRRGDGTIGWVEPQAS
jgi:hypothetical protein